MEETARQTISENCTLLNYVAFQELMFLQKPVLCFSTAIQRYWKQIDLLNDCSIDQIDAYGLLHFFKFGHCDIDTADRLLAKKLLERVYVSDRRSIEREYPKISSKGLNAIWLSLNDERVLYGIFPFIRDFGWLFVSREEKYERCATYHRATQYFDRSVSNSIPEFLRI